ncbi:uncharacterized protein F5891DRAFT_1131772 [Suillus fuscotomentosus]|uniref:Uncharacterized protein n=1 Tax=Suillus fuscotomentosus TaxID=1912939 RepID=A0AAD4HCX8_9AGAM|nr:uncharacterized protein F5891DRAFT_1131772 [Suillus fuscotomentosus]KAG1889687.1 hypothetical protein F5891DRAFT_1131772 [Suillus fuscotomentosus]
MHDYSFNIPNAQERSVLAGEPNLEAGEGLEVQDEGLEAEESGLEAGEFNLEAGEADIEAGNWDIEAGDQDIEAANSNIPPTPVLNPKETYRDYHLELNGKICDQFLDPDTLPPPFTTREHGDWTPFHDRTEFKTAEFLYTQNQMSGGDIDKLMYLWERTLAHHGDIPPFADHKDLYSTIDAIPLGEDEMEYMPYHEWKGEGDDAKQQWRNVMSGDWAWNQADEIAKDPAMHGSTFVPILLGSDKTTVSVATGQNDYYPLYASIGNVYNSVRCAHRNAVTVVGFLAIPKTVKKYSDDAHFRKFKKHLFHSSLSQILRSFKTFMTVPEVMRFGDGHFRRVIYGLGPYIADYPEQVVLSCIVSNWCAKCLAFPTDLDGKDAQLRARVVTDILCDNVDFNTLWCQWGVDADVVPFTNDYPCADIHELLSPNILHQLIKGTFKDHLVTLVEKYLEHIHGKTHAKVVMDDIDRRIAAVPSFTGLHWFPQGRCFTQWTGNNLKALMKVYLPVIEGHVPDDVVQCFRAFLEFCYLRTLKEIEEALDRFHHYRKIFQETGIHFDGFSLPCQHSLVHYVTLIHMFSVPNGVCSSITESKHIKAVKEPWRRSSKFNALGQMLLTNQRLDKLAAARTNFIARGMLGPHPELDVSNLPQLVHLFLYDQLLADNDHTSYTVPLSACPRFEGRIKVFGSAAATFFAPSDPSSIGGMLHEHICSIPSWCGGPGRYDTIFVNTQSEGGIHGMEVAHVLCFFSFHHGYGHDLKTFPCALVHWFKLVFDEPDPGNGMWMVKPSFLDSELDTRELSIIHIDTIVRAAHLLPIFGNEFVPEKATFHETLDIYCVFYVNKFADHHSFEIAS